MNTVVFEWTPELETTLCIFHKTLQNRHTPVESNTMHLVAGRTIKRWVPVLVGAERTISYGIYIYRRMWSHTVAVEPPHSTKTRALELRPASITSTVLLPRCRFKAEAVPNTFSLAPPPLIFNDAGGDTIRPLICTR